MTTTAVPGSKSLTARALFLAACAPGTSTLHRPLHSDDTEAFAGGLRAMGHRVTTAGDRWTVEGSGAGPCTSAGREVAEVNCRDAATAGALPARAGRRRTRQPSASTAPPSSGPGRSPPRHGAARRSARTSGTRGPTAGFPCGRGPRAAGRDPAAGRGPVLAVPDRAAAGGPADGAGNSVEVTTDLVSVPYVDMTLSLMRHFGAEAEREGRSSPCAPAPTTRPTTGWSPTRRPLSYFLAAAAVTGRTVTVPGLAATPPGRAICGSPGARTDGCPRPDRP